MSRMRMRERLAKLASTEDVELLSAAAARIRARSYTQLVRQLRSDARNVL